MSPIDGRRHPKGDKHGKPIPRDKAAAGGCPMAPAQAVALAHVAAFALIAARPGPHRAVTRRAGQLPHP